MQSQPSGSSNSNQTQKPKVAYILSLIAGVCVLIEGLIRLIESRAIEISGFTDEIRRRVLAGIGIHIVGGIVLIFGILVIVGAVLLYQPSMRTVGAILVLVFSILGIIASGMFALIGLVLGVIGAVLALTNK